VLGRTPGPTARLLVGLAPLVPLANAGMLIASTRDSPPAFIFGAVGLATLAAARRYPAG
jgi:hypothetical protein